MAKGAEAGGAGGGAVYGLGFIGAAIYYFQAADEFWEFVLAVPKALVRPRWSPSPAARSFYG